MRFRSIAVVISFSMVAFAQQPDASVIHRQGIALLEQARASAASAVPLFRPDILDEIAIAYYEVGEKDSSADILNEALSAFQERLAERRNIPQRQTSAHSGSGSGLSECGLLAAMMARRHISVNDRSGARKWLTAALNIFPSLYDQPERIFLGMGIYKVQLALGDVEGARKTVAATYPSDRQDFTAWGDIAAQIARNGDVASARAMAAKQPEIPASQILSKVAIAQAELKDFIGALDTAALIHHPYMRVDTVAAIGEEEAEAGDKPGALATFTTALQLQPQGSAVSRSLILAEARSGFFENALQLLAAGSNYRPASREYLDVGVLAAAAKRPDIAKQCFAAALALIQKESEAGDSTNSSEGARIDDDQVQLQFVVRAEAQAGEFADALQTSDLLSPQYKAFALAAIASAQASAGDVHGAEQTMAKVPSRHPPFPALIEAEAAAGNFIAAFNAARPAGSHELERVFHAYCKPETATTCLRAASDLTFPERRAGALLGVAESLLGISPTPMPGSSSNLAYPVPSR